MQAAKVMAALFAIGCVCAPVVQAQTRSPRSYSKVEIDKKIDQIRRDLIAKIPTPEQIEALLGPVYSKTDVDQKLNQLSATIPRQTVSQQDLDKALQQTVSRQDFDKALQQTISRQDLNEAIAGATDSVALLANFGPVVLTDFGSSPVPQPTVARLDRGTWRGLESQSGMVRAASSGA
jgi:hypothetical protein